MNEFTVKPQTIFKITPHIHLQGDIYWPRIVVWYVIDTTWKSNHSLITEYYHPSFSTPELELIHSSENAKYKI